MESLAKASLLSGDHTLFRGRFMNVKPRSQYDFGPLPTSSALPGRYNRKGEAVLYLCTSCEGVSAEKGAPPEGEALWVQEYRLPLEQQNIVDASHLPADSFAATVFWVAESQRDRNLEDGKLRLSHTVAELVTAEYDGMYVPGVRGDRKLSYSNLVVFRPATHWRDWVNIESALFRYAP
jgi:hypothetical protein